MNTLTPWMESLTPLFGGFAESVSSYFPRVLAALLLIIVGAAVARAAKRLLIKILSAFNASKLVEDTPVEHFLKHAELKRIEDVAGSVLYWFIMLVVFQSVAAVLGLESLTQVFEGVLNYLPNVLRAIIVLFIGILLAGLVESLVKGSIRSVDGRSSRLLGKVSSYMVVTIVVLAAIAELGIASDLITILFIGFVATVSLGLGLALGLGGKDLVSKILGDWYVRNFDDKK